MILCFLRWVLTRIGFCTAARDACFSLVKSSHVADSLSRGGWSCTEESVGVEEEGRTFFFPTTCHPDILEIIYGLGDTKHIPKSPKSSLKRGILRQVTQHRAGCGFSHVCLPALLPNVKQAGTRASEASPDPSLSSVGGLGVPSKSILLPYEV